MSTAHDLPVPYGEPAAAPVLRLLPTAPLDFDEAVLHLRPRLHRYAVRRLGDTHEAEELVQEALLRAYTHRDQLGTADDLAAWTTVVTGRLVIDRLRVRGRFTPVSDVPEGPRVGRDTADVVVGRDEARLALDSLDAMPSRQAALLWAREVEGHSYEELCQRFGMTEPAVRSVLTRARKALRKEYAARGGTLPVGGLAVLAPWIAGLSWAEKLRRAAERVTAPAALGAAGITVLGGLLLSPFGVLPTAPGDQVFRPSQAVVISAEPAALHGFVMTRSESAGSTQSPAPAASPSARTLGRQVTAAVPCVNDRDSGGGYSTVELPSLPGNASAGTTGCDGMEQIQGNSLWVNVPLPADEATGITYLTVTSSEFDCASTPENPLVKCIPESTQPGAQK